MLAYKFLGHDGSTVISGFRWPKPADAEPGPWLEAVTVRPCREGIHACRASDLAHWVHEELWEVELDGEIAESRHKVVGQRGRLLRRRDDWSGDVATELASWSAWRCRDLAVTLLRQAGAEEWARRLAEVSTVAELRPTGILAVEQLGDASVAGRAVALASDAANEALSDHLAVALFIAACARGHGATGDTGKQADYDHAYRAERQAQSGWIVSRLSLV